MKKYLFIATALAALASCSDNEFVGDVGTTSPTGQENGVISFTSSSKAVTRAIIGETAAGMLNNNFVLLGTKGTSHDVTVFNNYQANYVSNTANTTESNSSNWEYVGYKNLPSGVGTNVGVTAFAATTNGDPNNSTAIDQTIKYWDYAAPQYDFAAYSLGKGAGTTPTYATASAISFASLGSNAYTLTGSADELKACYISDLVTAYNINNGTTHISDYGNPVLFSFRSLAAKIRIAFYETIPGYSVKDVQFYTAATGGTADNIPTLFTSTAVLPSGSGTMTVKFPTTGLANRTATDYNKAHVSFAQADGSSAASTLPFGILTNYATSGYEGALTSGEFIGRTSNTATYADGTSTTGEGQSATTISNPQGTYYTVLPNETGANLQLRIKYTLQSTDNYGETITVDNATAVVPAELAQWNPNYAYTYIFKIGDMTNGSTGTDGNGNIVYGLTPITLDAVVVDSETGVQETITTVSEPSITTYTKGVVVTANDEYVTGNNIYVIVNNGTSNEVLTDKAKLYTVTIEDGAAQTISEESVANAIAKNTDGYGIGEKLAADTPLNGYYTYNSSTNTYVAASGSADGTTTYYKPATYSVKDANGKKLVVNEVANDADDKLSIVSVIDAADSPTGNEINIGTNKVGKFTAGAAGTNYVFQYVIQAPEAAGTYDETTAAAYNATLPGAITDNNVTVYSFTSYSDGSGSTTYGTGMVKVVSTDTEGGWTTVEVISNTSTDANAANFVGNQYRVKATTLNGEIYYQLYEIESETTLPIYVKVENSSPAAYNATLEGHVSNGDEKPAVPGKYQYKVIKVASGD